MLNRDQKTAVTNELRERFAKSSVSIFTDIRGIPVAKLTALRRDLRQIGAELKVAKKTLLGRALGDTTGFNPKGLEGEVAVIFGYEDQALPAKTALKFSKQNGTFKVLAGILGKKVIAAKDVIALAKLPGREVLLAQIASAMQGPIRGLALALAGNIRNLVSVLEQVKRKKS